MTEFSKSATNFEDMPYLCPHSRTRLKYNGETLLSDDGKYTYPIHNGIPSFLRYESAESKETTEKLERLNEQAKSKGWLEALKDIYSSDPGLIKYVTDKSRSIFLDLIPLTPNSDVLEIGPGLGQFTGLIASKVNKVYALEVVEGQAQFVKEHCRQINANNVEVACGGDDCMLPYQDQTFDVVILNLVFEWCGTREASGSHTDAQLRLIREVHRVLKPNGSLYLATKNRYALKYLLGKQDEHAYNMRFGNALPRWLMHLFLKLKGKNRAAGFLYSHNHLRRILLSHNFTRIRSFWAAPEFRFPERFIPTDSKSIREVRTAGEFHQGDIRSVRLLMPLLPSFLVKHLTPGLVFLAFKGDI